MPGHVFQVWLDGNQENPRVLSVQSNTVMLAVFAPGQGAPPVLASTPPAAATKGAGTSLTLRAAAVGSPPLDFRWYFEDSPIPNATHSELTLTNLQAGAEGTYRVVVDNGLGTASAETELTIVSSAQLEPLYVDDHLRFWMNLCSEPGGVFLIEASEDLVNWARLMTLTNVTGSTPISQSIEDQRVQHYYRLGVSP